MRIWNVPCEELSRMHLLGEHVELHTIWNTITLGYRGWASHPETKRWRGRLGALYARHEEQVREMQRRGYDGHNSPLDKMLIPATDSWEWPEITVEDIEKDRADMRARYPGWRRDKRQNHSPTAGTS